MTATRAHRLACMTGFRSMAGALSVLACSVALTSCGGSGDDITIPRDQGDSLLSQLNTISTAVGAGDCDTALSAARSFSQTISNLDPETVGDDVRGALLDASQNLVELAEDQCEPDTGASGEAGTIPPPEEQPLEPTETVEPEIVEPETAPEDTEEQPGNSGQGQSNGNSGNSGNGNSGGGGSKPPSGGIEG